jgi:uncharacterized protein YhbP (UPF0306 family)
MHPDILAFLKTQRVCVFAIEMMDGSPHGATVHFANTEDPTFIVLTEQKYRKAEPLHGRKESRATMVIGFEEEPNSRTLQMDGTARLVNANEGQLKDAYLEKFPNMKSKINEPDDFFFAFMPSWWRFTDWTKPEGKTIYLSDGSITVASKNNQLKVS